MRDYIIVTPGYRHNSNGVKTMHYLAHCINEAGGYAALLSCDGNSNLNPDWSTCWSSSVLPDDDIVIYPDIISGNPLDAQRVVRWYLNRPGYVSGVPVSPGPHDLIYDHSAVLGLGHPVLHLLPPAHPAFFAHGKEQRQWNCVYQGKSHTRHRLPGLNKDKIEITRDWPETPENLAKLLRHANCLYTYDPLSATCLDAVLCGCLVVVVPTPPYGFKDLVKSELGCPGIALDMSPEEIARAKDSLPQVRARFLDCFMTGREAVKEFIQTTQAHFA